MTFSYIQADNNYSTFHFPDGTKKMVAYTLKKFENEGIRISKSVIVNPDYILQVFPDQVQMKDLTIHKISRRRTKGFHSLQFNNDYTKVKKVTNNLNK